MREVVDGEGGAVGEDEHVEELHGGPASNCWFRA